MKIVTIVCFKKAPFNTGILDQEGLWQQYANEFWKNTGDENFVNMYMGGRWYTHQTCL
jgi:hypothetical protein